MPLRRPATSTASVLSRWARPQERRYSAHDAYATSKLAMMLITAEQAQRWGASPTSNCLDPGTVNTKLLDAGAPRQPWLV